MDLIVTAEGFPFGVRCRNCNREIKPGEPYKLRDSQTGKLSAGLCTEDTIDYVYCGWC